MSYISDWWMGRRNIATLESDRDVAYQRYFNLKTAYESETEDNPARSRTLKLHMLQAKLNFRLAQYAVLTEKQERAAHMA